MMELGLSFDLPSDFPLWAAALVSLLLLTGATRTLIASIALLRLENFYQRVHSPPLGTTLGAGGVLLASMLLFRVLESRPVLHELLIAIFVPLTTPVTLMLLVRATRHRDMNS